MSKITGVAAPRMVKMVASVPVMAALLFTAVACEDLASDTSAAGPVATVAAATTTTAAATTTEQTAGPATAQPESTSTTSSVVQPSTSTTKPDPQPTTGTTSPPAATTSTTGGPIVTGLSVGPWVSVDLHFLEPNVETVFTTPLSPTQLSAIDSAVTLTFAYDPTSGQAAPGQLSPLKNRIYHVLWLMRSLEFDETLPWTGQSLWGWFCASVDEIVFEQGDYNAYYDGKIHVPIEPNDYCMLTDKFVDPPLSGGLMDTMVLFIHEARHQQKVHTDGNDDKTISELGSWGVQYYTYLYLVDKSNYFMDDTTIQILQQHAQMVKNAHITQE